MHIEEHDVADRVVIPHIVLDLLVVPLELAAVYIERDDAVAVKVVPATVRPVEVRVWIAGAEDDEPELGIDRGRCPHHAAAALPGIAGICLWIGRHPAPALLPGLCVVGRYESAQRPFAPGAADDDHSVVDLRRERLRVPVLGAHDGRLPDGVSVGGVERQQVIVERRDIDSAVAGRDAAVDWTAANLERSEIVCDVPEPLARRRVHRHDDHLLVDDRSRDVHHAVDDDWSRLEARRHARLKERHQVEGLDVVGRNLFER